MAAYKIPQNTKEASEPAARNAAVSGSLRLMEDYELLSYLDRYPSYTSNLFVKA